MDTSLIITGVAFIQLVILLLAIIYYIDFRRQKRAVNRRFQMDLDGFTSDDGIIKKRQKFIPHLKEEMARLSERIGSLLKPKKDSELTALQKQLLRAGFRADGATTIYMGIKSILAILLFIVSFPLLHFAAPKLTSLNVLMGAILFAGIGFYLIPSLYLSKRIAKRQKLMQQGFPDALDLLVVCVEAGLGLELAINRVAEEIKDLHGPLSDEFTLLCLELRAGKENELALKNMAMRIDLDDVSGLVTLLIQTEKFGTSLAHSLRIQSDYMRIKRFQRAEELAAKLPVKLLLPLILFIFPSLFVVIMGPAAIQILSIMGN